MTRQSLHRQSPVHRRQPLLTQECSSRGGKRFAEVAGGTTAECAAVCCCCPCSVINLLVLAVYKVPAGLCRKALRRKKRRRLIKKGLLVQGGDSSHQSSSCDGADVLVHPAVAAAVAEMTTKPAAETDESVMELEKEMWERFYGTGFWRSPSQREDDDV